MDPPMTRATANQRIAALREMEVQRVTLTKPNLPSCRGLVQAAQAAQLQERPRFPIARGG